jgi:butyryl-CoA dehydrogenase
MMCTVADELVATMGGYGYVEEFAAERVYRDARINKIFEGTNEINRLIVSGWLMKRAMSGKLPLLKSIGKVMEEAMAPPSFESDGAGGQPLARETETLAAIRKIALFAAGVASQRFLTALQDQQEIMAGLADVFMQVFALESALLRALKLRAAGANTAEVAAAMTGLLADEAIGIVDRTARRILVASAEGDTLRTQLMILRRLARTAPADTVALSREVAKCCSHSGRYPLF